MTYSLDFRTRVLAIKKEEGLTYEQAAERFKVGRASLLRWNKEIQPKTKRNKPPVKIDNDKLREDVAMYPDAYQYERAARFNVSQRGIGAALKRLGFTRKKRH